MGMNNELLAYFKEFDTDEYWLDEFIKYEPFRDFIQKYKNNPNQINLKFMRQQDLGIGKKIDFLISEFLNDEKYLPVFEDDFERELFEYKLIRRLH